MAGRGDCERSPEQGDHQARCRERDLERPVYLELAGVVARSLEGIDVPAQLRVAHLLWRFGLYQQVGGLLLQRAETHGLELELVFHSLTRKHPRGARPHPPFVEGIFKGRAVGDHGEAGIFGTGPLPFKYHLAQRPVRYVERTDGVHPTLIGAVDEVVPCRLGLGELGFLQFQFFRGSAGREFPDHNGKAGGEQRRQVEREGHAVEALPAGLGRRQLRVPSQVPHGKNGGEQDRRRHHEKNILRHRVEVAHHDLLEGEPAVQEFLQVVGHVDDDRHEGKPQRGKHEDGKPRTQDVAIEQSEHHQATHFRRKRPVSDSHRSAKSPPRVDPDSRPTR